MLERAEAAAREEDADATARGADLSYRSDRQRRYPQDWSHERFVAFLRSAPREVVPPSG